MTERRLKWCGQYEVTNKGNGIRRGEIRWIDTEYQAIQIVSVNIGNHFRLACGKKLHNP